MQKRRILRAVDHSIRYWFPYHLMRVGFVYYPFLCEKKRAYAEYTSIKFFNIRLNLAGVGARNHSQAFISVSLPAESIHIRNDIFI